MPVALELLRIAAREIVRALAVPLHLVAFLLRRARWREVADLALAAPSPASSEDREAIARVVPRVTGTPRVFLSCGEASGEELALRLLDGLDALRAGQPTSEPAAPAPRIFAFGGARLRARGVDLRFPLAEHAVMGLAGVLRSIPVLIRALACYLRLLQNERPDLVVLIDYPGLHLVMAEAARRRGIPVVHWVAPQYWAWGPWRMRRYRHAVDATLTILPFEPAFFAATGLASRYVGHPLLDAPAAARHPGVDGDRPILLLLPGSRRKEIALHLDAMVDVARTLRRHDPGLRVLVAHRDPERVASIEARLAALPDAGFVEVVAADPSGVLPRARACLVKSGTGSLQACLAQVPSVVVYVVQGPLARLVRRHLLTVPFFASANLCMARAIVPEFAIERPNDWDRAGRALASLWDDGPARTQCLRDLADLRARLGEPGASRRAALWIHALSRGEGSSA
ncbi:MAG: hypothetical protein HZB39_01755 [Planctomycetes bacterium]|nr:hypothetical protein [Planctomycetota bacterium]